MIENNDFINNPLQSATKQEYEYDGMIWDDAVMAGLDSYDKEASFYNPYIGTEHPITEYKYTTIWNTKVGEIYKAPSGREFIVFDRSSTVSGMNATALMDVESGRVHLSFQGSVPSITEPLKNPISYIQDWGNNIAGNSGGTLQNVKIGNIDIMGAHIEVTPVSLKVKKDGNLVNAYYLQVPNLSMFLGSEIGRNQQYEDAYYYTKQIMEKTGKSPKLKGHSMGGGTTIDVGSRLDLEVTAVDPAPVNNPGKYVDDGKIWVYVPNYGEGLLNRTSIVNGRKVYKFSPLGLPNLGIGKETEGIAFYDNVGEYINPENGKKSRHEPYYWHIREKESEISSFYMPLGPVRE